jgi:opacity protein-like surface antigen
MFLSSAQWKNISLGCLLCLVTLLPAKAQLPLAASQSTAFDTSLGGQYTRLTVPGSGKTGMAGPKATFTAVPFRRIGVRADFAYQRSDNLLGSGQYNDVLTYMGGPVFYAIHTYRTDVYGQALIGGARVTGVNNTESGGYLSAYANKLAWSFGAGVQRNITSAFALRLQADYLHTSFFDPAETVKGSYSLSGSLALVYSFGPGHSR